MTNYSVIPRSFPPFTTGSPFGNRCVTLPPTDPAAMHRVRPLYFLNGLLIEAWERMGRDIQQARHQDMRSLVCAKCHVE